MSPNLNNLFFVTYHEVLRLMTTQEKSSLTHPAIFMVVFSHEKEEDSV